MPEDQQASQIDKDTKKRLQKLCKEEFEKENLPVPALLNEDPPKGEKILLLAERYSNADISARICGILGNYPLTENGVATRIHVALEKRAKATGATTMQVRGDLNAARIASGAVKPTPRGRGIMRASRGPKASKSVRLP
jgi:hypothetical protein